MEIETEEREPQNIILKKEWFGCAQGEDTIHNSFYYHHLQSWHWWGAERFLVLLPICKRSEFQMEIADLVFEGEYLAISKMWYFSLSSHFQNCCVCKSICCFL